MCSSCYSCPYCTPNYNYNTCRSFQYSAPCSLSCCNNSNVPYFYSPPKATSLEEYYSSYSSSPSHSPTPSYLYPSSFGGAANWYYPSWKSETTTSIPVPDYKRTCSGDTWGRNSGGESETSCIG